jgi:DNA-binding CsgD family transcriptional regulator
MTSLTAGAQSDEPLGREVEQDVVNAFLDNVAKHATALVVSGPAGIGKSTIWRAAIGEARRRGFRTLVTRAVEAEAELSFAALADLLDASFDDVASRLPDAQRTALAVALQRVPDDGAPPPPLAVSLGAVAAIRAIADAAPVLIAVDDLPWLDGPSARVVEFVSRRVEGLPIGLLAAIRTASGEPEPRIEFAGPVQRLAIGPLGIDAIDALLRRDLDLALPRPDLAWVARESRGNAFFAAELGRALRRSGSRPGLDVPSFVTDQTNLIRSRLDALPNTARLPLAVIATTSQPTRDLVVAADPEAGSAIEAAIDAGVIERDDGRLRFSHPLLASSAYARLEAEERRRLHARLAAVIADPEQRARHLALAAMGPDPIVAVELDTAAAHARLRGASDSAGELALMARRLTPTWQASDIQRRVLTAAGAFIQAGDPSRARAILEEHVDAIESGPERADALRILADVRSSDNWDAKLSTLDQALQEAGPDPGLRSRILEARSQALLYVMRDADEGLANAIEAVAEARRQDDPAVLCSALQTLLFAKVNIGETLDRPAREEAMRLADRVDHLRVFQWPGYAFALTELEYGNAETADRILVTLHDRAAERGDWDSLPLIAGSQAYARYRLGRWQEALAVAQEAVRGSRQNGQATGLGWALSVQSLIELGLGHDDAVDALRGEIHAVASGVHAVWYAAQVRTLAGLCALDRGDAVAAEREFREAGEPMLAHGYVGLFLQDVLARWAEALVASGRADEAIALLDRHEDALRRSERPVSTAAVLRVQGLAKAAVGDEAGAESAFQAALALQVPGESPFPRGQTLLAHGEALRRARQRGRARVALTEAVTIFEALPAPRWLARARAELERTGHRAPGARLSATEQQVADLVAAGRTNREVAETLFMSPHTVEAHLTRVYQSLGVRRRTELAAALRAVPDQDIEDQE